MRRHAKRGPLLSLWRLARVHPLDFERLVVLPPDQPCEPARRLGLGQALVRLGPRLAVVPVVPPVVLGKRDAEGRHRCPPSQSVGGRTGACAPLPRPFYRLPAPLPVTKSKNSTQE